MTQRSESGLAQSAATGPTSEGIAWVHADGLYAARPAEWVRAKAEKAMQEEVFAACWYQIDREAQEREEWLEGLDPSDFWDGP